MTTRPQPSPRRAGALVLAVTVASSLLVGCTTQPLTPVEPTPPVVELPGPAGLPGPNEPSSPHPTHETPGSEPPAIELDAQAAWRLGIPAGSLGLLLEGWFAAGAPPGPVPVTASAPTDARAAADPLMVTIDPAPIELGTPLVVSLTTEGSLAVTTDGGVVLRDAAGAVVAGISPPTGRARFVSADTNTARLVLRAPAEGQAATPVTFSIGERALVSAQWRERSDGPSLFVDPTPWARTSGEAGWALAWAELLAAHPEADTPGMHDQLVCHGLGAPDKETWNLEPWRPDAGLIAVMAARCNPTSR